MEITTILVISALCLLLPSTRIYALIGIGMVFYFHPVTTTGVLALAGITFYYIQRRNSS